MDLETLEKNEKVKVNSCELNRLKSALPQYFNKDGEFDIEKLKNMLKENEIDLSSEGFELKFLGKSYARYQAGVESETVIVPEKEHNEKVENKDSENIYIAGDNLDALSHLRKSYCEKIKMIYIDPPYNTGNNDFTYNDSFAFTEDMMIEKLGLEREEAGKILNLNGKSSHSAWLTFMYPRLFLSRELLKDDGVIFISIDDNEVSNLKLLCDDIFGEENFIGMLSVENNPKGRKNSKFISVSSEYCVIYGKNKSSTFFVENIPKKASDMKKDENGRYVHNSGKRVLVGENDFNEIVTNTLSDKNYSVYYNSENLSIKFLKEAIGEEKVDLISRGYKKYYSHKNGQLVENTYTQKKFLELFNNNSLEFANEKIYEKNYSDTIRIKSQLVNREYEAIVHGKKENFSMNLTTTGAGTKLKELFKTNRELFTAPKSVDFLKLLITLFDEKDFIVLDFFSGSATTAQGVMELNAEDGGNRKFILVQLPEDTRHITKDKAGNITYKETETSKAGFKNICEIGKDRIIRSAKKIELEKGYNRFLGFKSYKLRKIANKGYDAMETFNRDITIFDDEIITSYSFEGRDPFETILTTYLIRDGYGFSNNCKEIAIGEYSGHLCGSCLYLLKQGFDNICTNKLIEKLENREFEVNTIIIYSYSFTYNDRLALETNIKNLKNIKFPKVEVRY